MKNDQLDDFDKIIDDSGVFHSGKPYSTKIKNPGMVSTVNRHFWKIRAGRFDLVIECLIWVIVFTLIGIFAIPLAIAKTFH